MTLKIIRSEFAETQLDEIYEYYEKQVLELLKNF